MLKKIRLRPNSYAVGVLLVFAATILTQLLEGFLVESQTLLFLAAVIGSSWYGGLKPGGVAAILSTVAVNFFFMPPVHNLTIASLSQGMELAIFLLVALLGCLPGTQLKQAKYQVRALSDRQAALHERKQAETALWQYERVVSATPDGMALVDRTYTYRLVNQTYLNANQKRREEIVGHTVSELMGETAFQTVVKPQFDRCLAGETVRYETWFDYPDGKQRFVGVTYAPYIELDGTISGVVVTGRDLTDLRRAEDQLRESEERFRMIFENAGIGIAFITPPDYTLKLTNPFFQQMTGYSAADLTSLSPDALTHPEDLALEEPLNQECRAGLRSNYQLEKRYIRKDGEVIWVNLIASVIFDQRNQVKYAIGMVKDITSRKAAEATLQRQADQEQAFNRVVEAIRNSLDLDTIFSTATQEFAELLQLDGVGLPQYLPERHCWMPVAEHMRKPGTLSLLGAEIPDVNNPITDRLKQREIVLIEDTYTLDDPVNRSIAQQGPQVGWLMVPLQVNEQVWGCLVAIKSPVPATFTEDEVQLARRFADQLAIAIQQANLYQQVQQLNRVLEQRVAEQTAQLHSALSAAGMGAWEKDLTTQIEHWSPETYELLGLRRGEQGRVLDRNGSEISPFPTHKLFCDLIHPADRVQFERAHQQSLQQRSAVDCEFRVVWTDGTVRWCHSRSAYVYNEQGQPIKLAGVSLDITNRKQAESEILRTRNLFEATFERSADAIFLVDPNTFLTMNCNQRAVELFEAECKQQLVGIRGRTLHKHPFTTDDRFAATQALATGGYWSAEIEYLSLKGRGFWGSIAASQIQAGDQQLHLVRITDISDRKQTEQVLEQQLQREHLIHTISQQIRQSLHLDEILATTVTEVRRVLQTDRVVIFRLRSDRSGHVIQESVAADLPPLPPAIFPYEIFSDRVYDFYCQGNVRVFFNAVEDESGECPSALMQQLGVKSKIVAPIVQRVHHPQQNGENQNTLWGLLITYTYVSPREWLPSEIDLLKQLATQVGIALQKANLYTQLETQLAQKEILLKEVHHRVKNNLQVISSMLWLQTKTAQHPTLSRALTDTRNRLQAMALIHETLYQSHNLGELNFHDYIQSLSANILSAHSTSPSQINLIYHLQPVTFNLDTAIPCGLLLNELLTNAVKHAFPNGQAGEICITLEQRAAIAEPGASSLLTSQLSTSQSSAIAERQKGQSDSYVLTIQDNGIGISEDLDLKQMKSLGLKIAHDLALQLRGSLVLKRTQGTRFQLTFSALEYRKRF